MAINGMNRTLNVAGVFAGGMDRAPSRAATRWPWPQPMNSVLAVLDERAAAPGLLAAFEGAGIDTAEIWTVSGEDGAREIRDAAARRGPLASLRGMLDGDDELMMQLAAWSAQGETIAIVRPPREQTAEAIDVITRLGVSFLRRTGLWVYRTEARSGDRAMSGSA